MSRNRHRWIGVRSPASRGSPAARRHRRLSVLEGLEDRVLLSGSPTIYTVDATSDTDTGSGDSGDLRYCINQANALTTAGGSWIQFSPTVFTPSFGVVITLSSSLELSEKDGPEVIEGTVFTNPPPAPLANTGVGISGNFGFPIFRVDTGVMASFSGLSMTRGYSGIYNSGTLAVTNCNFEDNGGTSVGGGDIQNYGTMTITGSFISGVRFEDSPAYGGIANYGTMTVDDSTIESNAGDGDEGGGILNTGSLTVTDSTIADNQAQFGGGIFNAGTATVINSTIADNFAGLGTLGVNVGGGGIASDGNSLTVVNSTVADNFTEGVSGGGLDVEGGTATLDNTIVALNTNQIDPGEADTPNDIAGTVSPDSAYNLIGTGGTGGLTGGTNHNQVGVAYTGLFQSNAEKCCGPYFQGLDNNGGPTETIALIYPSPAIDTGSVDLAVDPTTGQPLTTDQRRGFPRTAGGTVDIGAYEFGVPQTFMVNSLTSTGTGSGNAGDLMYCIEQANANPDTAGSVIEFDPTVFATPQTITLSSTLELSETNGPETIDGPGASLAIISGNSADQVFIVDSGTTATITGLAIDDGLAPEDGGGINNDGTLTVTDCTIANNSAPDGDAIGGGIYNGGPGTLTVNDCTIAGNDVGDFGGGIGSFGTLSVNDCTFSQNYARDHGGAIGNISGKVTVSDSTLSDNRGGAVWTTGGTLSFRDSTLADNTDGPGISAPSGGTVSVSGCTIAGNSGSFSGGGGIFVSGEALTIANSTIADNSAEDGGGIKVSGTLTVVNSTIADNSAEDGGGGGLDVAGGTATLDNTIVALNTEGTGSGAPADDIAGSIAAASAYNLIGTGGSGGLTNGSNGNQVGVADPGLDPNGLQWNGGPTQTIALVAGSPAIGAGSNALAVDVNGNPLTTDQRGSGFSRIVNQVVDIGAFAEGNPTGYLVNLTSDTGAGSDGAGDLLYCITQANANTNPFGSLIEFDPTDFTPAQPQTIKLATTLELTETAGPETIVGPGTSVVAISGNKAVGVFDVAEGVTAALSGLTISGGMTNQSGGGIDNQGTLAVTNCTIENNSASSGGGINNDGTLTVTNCTIESNSAPFGAGTYNDGILTVTESTIESNSATEFGGGIDNDDGGMATLTDATVDMNSAVDSGGGILNHGHSTLTLTNSTFSDNSAASGGGIDNNTSKLTVNGSTLSANEATGTTGNDGGGGVYNSGGTVSISGSTFAGNTATQGGGGIFANAGALTILDSTLSGNRAGVETPLVGAGGGLYENSGTLTVTNSTIADNSAEWVGAGIDENAGTLTAVNCTIAYNNEPSQFSGFGGGMNITNGTATLDNTIIALNTDGTGPGTPPNNLYLDGSGTVSDASAHNLIGNGGGNSGLESGQNGNQVGVADPGLDTGLASNGGPTQTIALLSGSPAIDGGSNSLAVDANGNPLTTDQRGAGFARVFGGTVDVGAFELQTATTTNPAPTLSTILPDRIAAGYSSPITLTVTGSGFISQSVVDWNSAALATSYVSPTELTATIPSSDLASVGTATITVTNPPPGGGASTGATFQVLAAPTTVYVSPGYAALPLGTAVTWTDGSTHYVGYDAFGTVDTGVAAVAAGGTVDFDITSTNGYVYPDNGNTFLVVSLLNGSLGEIPDGDTIGFSGSGGIVVISGESLAPDAFIIKDTSVQFNAADGLHGMKIDFDGSGLTRNVIAEGTTNTFDIEGAAGNGPTGVLNGYGNNNSFVFGLTGNVLGSIASGLEGTLNYSAYSTGVTVNLGNAVNNVDNGTDGTATGVSGSVEGITSVIGSNFNDNLSAGSVPFVALMGGLGTNSLSGTGTGDSVMESIASSYTLTNSTLSGPGASFTDNLSGIRVANLTGSGVLGNSFTVSGWTGSGSLVAPSGFEAVIANKNANITLTNSALSSSDGMSLSLLGINIANLTVSASAGSPTDVVDASTFSGVAELSAAGTVDAILYGDSDGSDTLAAAGSGNDILIGYAGHDTLTDSDSGHNILIGAGAGGDTFTANRNDILVSGTTKYDGDTTANIAALDAILAEWASSASYAKRISTIAAGLGGRKRLYAFNSHTIQSDGNANTLADGNRRVRTNNWFLVSKHDSVTKRSNETKTII